MDDKELISKAEAYCAKEEQCCSSVRKKLYDWGAGKDQVAVVVNHLLSTNFINEERYAEAYVRGKFHQQKWGRIKLNYQLKAKQIPEAIITSALKCIDEQEYMEMLSGVAATKWQQLHTEEDRPRRNKVMQYLGTKGFEMNLVQQAVSLLQDEEQQQSNQ